MKKSILLFGILLILGFSSYAQSTIEYKQDKMSEIVKNAIQISTEHITEDELSTRKNYTTYFFKSFYSIDLKWVEPNEIIRASDDAFVEIKASLMQAGKPKDLFDKYYNYVLFQYEKYFLVFVFSDNLKEDFNKWVKYGDVVNLKVQLVSVELKTKVFIFIVNEYEV